MNRRRLAIYTRSARPYRRRSNPLNGLLTLFVAGIIIGGLFSFYERLAVPAAPRATVEFVPISLIPPDQMAPRPTPVPVIAAAAAPAAKTISFLAPTAGISTQVVDVYLSGTSWDVSRLGQNAGHLQGTAAFGAPGNLALAGHVEMADGRPGVFANIGGLKMGDPIILSQGSVEKRYIVSAIKRVSPDDLTVLYPTDGDQLTLITCGSYDFFQDVYQERVVVIANRAA